MKSPIKLVITTSLKTVYLALQITEYGF